LGVLVTEEWREEHGADRKHILSSRSWGGGETFHKRMSNKLSRPDNSSAPHSEPVAMIFKQRNSPEYMSSRFQVFKRVRVLPTGPVHEVSSSNGQQRQQRFSGQ